MPSSLNIPDAEKLQRKLLQNKLAQAKHRELNKDAVNARRRELYNLKKQGKTQPAPTPVIVPPVNYVEPEDEIHQTLDFENDFVIPPPKAKRLNKKIVLQDDQPPVRKSNRLKGKLIIEPDSEDEKNEIITLKKTTTKKTKSYGKIKVLTLDDAIQAFKDMQNKGIIETGTTTLKKRISDIERVIKVSNCENIVECLNDFNKLSNQIENGTSSRGKKEIYALNVQRDMYFSLLKLADNLDLDVNPEMIAKFKKRTEVLKEQSKINSKSKKDNIIPHYDDYAEQIAKDYGEDSKIFIVTLIFDELHGCRDDFNLVLTNNPNIDKLNNFIVVNGNNNIQVKINVFKTKKNYPSYDITLSSVLSDKIRNYIKQKKYKNGDLIFGKSVSNMFSVANEKMGYKSLGEGAINLLRKMLATKHHKDDLTLEEQIDQAHAMKHSLDTHKTYLRTNKKK